MRSRRFLPRRRQKCPRQWRRRPRTSSSYLPMGWPTEARLSGRSRGAPPMRRRRAAAAPRDPHAPTASPWPQSALRQWRRCWRLAPRTPCQPPRRAAAVVPHRRPLARAPRPGTRPERGSRRGHRPSSRRRRLQKTRPARDGPSPSRSRWAASTRACSSCQWSRRSSQRRPLPDRPRCLACSRPTASLQTRGSHRPPTHRLSRRPSPSASSSTRKRGGKTRACATSTPWPTRRRRLHRPTMASRWRGRPGVTGGLRSGWRASRPRHPWCRRSGEGSLPTPSRYAARSWPEARGDALATLFLGPKGFGSCVWRASAGWGGCTTNHARGHVVTD
mmetsp:Transcript_12989/g.42530  ORF Transcript_12989/g.42530 Transcript_12989/m.42530 type:complete len:332 (+) Transcript_12989:853-1848(+)